MNKVAKLLVKILIEQQVLDRQLDLQMNNLHVNVHHSCVDRLIHPIDCYHRVQL